MLDLLADPWPDYMRQKGPPARYLREEPWPACPWVCRCGRDFTAPSQLLNHLAQYVAAPSDLTGFSSTYYCYPDRPIVTWKACWDHEQKRKRRNLKAVAKRRGADTPEEIEILRIAAAVRDAARGVQMPVPATKAPSFFGYLCPHSHDAGNGLSERFKSSGRCVQCSRAKGRKFHRTHKHDPAYMREKARVSRAWKARQRSG